MRMRVCRLLGKIHGKAIIFENCICPWYKVLWWGGVHVVCGECYYLFTSFFSFLLFLKTNIRTLNTFKDWAHSPCNGNQFSSILENGSYYRASELMSSFHVFLSFRREQQKQTYQFPQGYNIIHRLQVHHLTLIHNKYLSTLYLYTYIHKYELF